LFARFSEKVAKSLGDGVGKWCTINEPNMVSTIGYLLGEFPPGTKTREARKKANEVFCQAHIKARDAVKSISSAPLGITLAMQEYTINVDDESHRQAAEGKRDMAWDGLEDCFLEVAKGDDYFGVQTYTRERFNQDGRIQPDADMRTTIMGYEFRPQALEACIRRAWDKTGHVPIIVTENGIATSDDAERIEYVHGALEGVLNCIQDGIDIRGYTYWSLMDNFEWMYGYGPTFGIVAVDWKTQVRTPRPSASWLGRIARGNALLPRNA
jgi:beta-glucosidase